MANPARNDDRTSLRAMGRVLDSRWMMALAVLAVLVAIAWGLLERNLVTKPAAPPSDAVAIATVQLLGVPPGAEVTLDGTRIHNTKFGVSPGTRHALEVKDPSGRIWRQVFVAHGELSLVVELREDFVEVRVQQANGQEPAED